MEQEDFECHDTPRGYIRTFIGGGQGKSWAALGMAFRAMTFGMKVHIVQFLKSDTMCEPLSRAEKSLPLFKIDSFGRHCPFVDLLKNGLINCRECKKCFVCPGKIKNMDRENAELAFEMAYGIARSGEYDVLVLDEVLRALEYGVIELDELLSFLKEKPERLEIVMTGHTAPPEIIKVSHSVVYLLPVKRRYGREIKPRLGIDY